MSTTALPSVRAAANDGLRRAIDVTVSSLGLLLVSPLLLALALLIVLDSPGPIFYRAERVGKAGRHFYLYKFRSMVVDAARHGPGITSAGDQRITRVGRFLRRTKLDELPQLLNVVRGEMSLVGPRPEDPRYVALYSAEERQLLSVRPGITSAATLLFRHEEALLTGEDWEGTYRTQIMPHKLAVDLAYLRQRTLWSDLHLIVRSIMAMAS